MARQSRTAKYGNLITKQKNKKFYRDGIKNALDAPEGKRDERQQNFIDLLKK
ncbi:hypothetical protein OAT84_00675 [Gammaproteobacteria bacterium]|nr:hypothetical protein [Gammaproteobacteria bacterium]